MALIPLQNTPSGRCGLVFSRPWPAPLGLLALPLAAFAASPAPNPATDGMEDFPPSLRGDGLYDDDFYPFIDRFGQYRHATWADKVSDEADLLARTATEQVENAALQPYGFGQYGGWKHGPRLEPTGFFRRAQVDGKWWLVDPEGYLFFANAVTTVSSVHRTDSSGSSAMRTGITGRETFFADLPATGTPARTLGLLAFETATVTSGDYQGQRPLAANFFGINALKQFPEASASVEALRAATSTQAFQRLRSWGFTTIGGWSDPDLFVRPDRRPYTHVLIYTHPGLINGSTTWLDYFKDAFVTNLRARLLQEVGTTIGDPYNVGFYIDNERDWTKSNVDARDLGLTTLAAPAEALDRYAKRVFRDQLQAKYTTIGALNAQWGVDYASWEDFLTRRDIAPAESGSAADMTAFELLYAETYFQRCRDAMREFAPQHLYLGNRFTTGGRDALVKLAGQYADVVTVNIYGSTVNSSFLNRLGAEGPFMSTEFHFFSLDSGLFAPAVASHTVRSSQALRAAAMGGYLASAIAHSRSVGGHWFQYFDYPTSGRLNSRNMNSNLGLVTTANLPYQDLVKAARAVNFSSYRTRFAPGTRQPAADTTVRSTTPTSAGGSETTVTINATSEAHLRWDLGTVSSIVDRAILVLSPTAGADLATHGLSLVADTAWSEATTTWNNRPAAAATIIAQWTAQPGLPVEIDVTPWVQRAYLSDRKVAFRITSLDGNGLTYGSKEADSTLRPQMLLIASPTTLAAWQSRYFNADSTVAGPTDDPDRDGLPNLLEYALARSPHEAETPPAWQSGTDASGRLTFTFYRARSDLTYTVETSSDLTAWSVLATNPGTAGQTVTVTDPATGLAPRFVRLRVQ